MRMFCSSCLLVVLLLASTLVHADEVLYNGVTVEGLRAEDFTVTKDGYVVGSIINDSERVRPAVRIDIWATDQNDTRIFWRKSINFGDMAPKVKYPVREPYSKDVDPTLPAKFSFKLSSSGPKAGNCDRSEGDCRKPQPSHAATKTRK